MEAKIKFYNEKKGFGFITDTESGKDLFFHYTGLLDKVTADDPVSYDVEEGDRGPKGVNIKKLNSD